MRDQFLKRVTSSRAWNCGGTSYIVPRFVANRLALDAQRQPSHPVVDSGTNLRADSGTLDASLPRSSSRSLKPTTTTTADTSLAEHELADSYGKQLEAAGVQLLGANDAMQLWRGGKYADPQHVIQSILHMDFYISEGRAQNVGSVKAFAMRELLKGFYGRPAGYKSPEEKQEEAILAAEEAKAVRMQALRRRRLEAHFKCWEAELADKERAQILQASAGEGGQFLSNKMVVGILREEYAKRFHAPELLEELAAQTGS